MTPDELSTVHPRIFHMAADGAWTHIRRYGLMSTAAILDLAGIRGQDREAIEEERRPESVVVTIPGGDRFVLRDQKPLHPDKLESCLVGMTVPEYLRLLNGKVFFWPTRLRCEQLLQARAYRESAHTVIEIDTERLLRAHSTSVTLSRINAGAVLYNPPERGAGTFVPLDQVPFDEWRRTRSRTRAIAEVAVDYAVPNVEAVTSAVYSVARGRWRELA